MALPTIEIDWRFNHATIGNQGSTGAVDYQHFWLTLKRMLTNGTGFTGNWTKCDGTVGSDPTACVVTQSSDSLVADATDRWNSVSDIVITTSNIAHSWIVLTFPGIGAGAQLCLDVVRGAGAANLLVSCQDGADPATIGGGFIFSHLAGFASSVLPARRPRVTPAQDETQIWQRRDSYGGSAPYLGALSLTTSWQAQMHMMRSSDGAQNRVVVYYGGLPLFFCILDKPKSPFSTVTPHTWNVDDVPWFGGAYGSVNTTINALAMITSGGRWVSDAPLYSRICSLVNPTARTVVQVLVGCEAYNGANTLTNGFNVASDIDGSYPMMPLSLIGATSGYRGRLGLLYDLWNVPPIMLEGDSFPNDNSKQYIVMGDFAFPWDRSVLAIL